MLTLSSRRKNLIINRVPTYLAFDFTLLPSDFTYLVFILIFYIRFLKDFFKEQGLC